MPYYKSLRASLLHWLIVWVTKRSPIDTGMAFNIHLNTLWEVTELFYDQKIGSSSRYGDLGLWSRRTLIKELKNHHCEPGESLSRNWRNLIIGLRTAFWREKNGWKLNLSNNHTIFPLLSDTQILKEMTLAQKCGFSRTTPSGRKVCEPERKERKIIPKMVDTWVLLQHPMAAHADQQSTEESSHSG